MTYARRVPADPERQGRPQGAARSRRASARPSTSSSRRAPSSSAGSPRSGSGELGISPIGVTDNFFDLGVTSLVAADAVRRDRARARQPAAARRDLPRADDRGARRAARAAEPRRSRWTSLVPIQPAGTQPPIFCIHGGAGTILHLAALARRLGDDQPFYGLQSRGLYGGAAPLKTVEEMATHYLSEMRQVHPERPMAPGGLLLRRDRRVRDGAAAVADGEDVELLAIFNGPSPAWIRNAGAGTATSPRGEATDLRQIELHREERFQRELGRFRRALREPRRLRTALIWYWKHAGGKHRARVGLALGWPLREEVREQYFLDLHARAEHAYEPELYDGDLVVFYGEGLYEDPELGWGGYTTHKIHTYGVPGDHNNNRQLMIEPFVDFVAERLQDHLDPSSPA